MYVILRIVCFENPEDLTSRMKFQHFMTLKKGDIVSMGRSRKCSFRLEDEFLSSVHCEFHFNGEKLELEDKQSKNGTKLNGVELHSRSPVYYKDVVIIGSTFIHIDEDRTPVETLRKLNPKRLDIKETSLGKFEGITAPSIITQDD